MTRIRDILVPTDFGETSQCASKHAMVLARALGARLHILNVIDPTLAVAPEMDGAGTEVRAILDALEKGSEEQMSRVLTPDQEERFGARLVTVSGSPSLEIIHYAQNNGIDLIVMGTRGRKPTKQMILGGVAERVMRSAPCPVLLCAPSSVQAVNRRVEAGAATSQFSSLSSLTRSL